MTVKYDSFIAEQIDIVMGQMMRKKEAEILELKELIRELHEENERQRLELFDARKDIDTLRKKYAGLLL